MHPDDALRTLSTLDWIVCLGSERAVTDGRVACPTLRQAIRPRTSRAELCLECRHLVASSIDRLARGTCSVGN
jgi:hypothetical protein